MPGNPESNQPNHEWRAPKPQPQPESEANPFDLLSREQRGEGERSHEELVANIRKELGAYMKRKQLDRYHPDPVDAMRDRLIGVLGDLPPAENPQVPYYTRDQIAHAQLLMAWELISQPYYQSAHMRGLTEVGVRDFASVFGHTITLDANEGKILAAMAEAVGIPNPFGPVTPEKQEPK